MEESRQDTFCMQENDIYMDTIHRFCNLCYEYKNMTKLWKKVDNSEDAAPKKKKEDCTLVYDLVQIKGFELKQHGELEVIKTFQSQVLNNCSMDHRCSSAMPPLA
jgi:hypothetical protein